MSVETWTDEFYTENASDFAQIEVNKDNEKWVAKKAILHSLKKWKGLTQENIKKHCLHKYGWGMSDDEDSFIVDAGTCALCNVYYNSESNYYEGHCEQCPIFKKDGVPCWDSKARDGNSLYNSFIDYGDPHPMIMALEECLELTEE